MPTLTLIPGISDGPVLGEGVILDLVHDLVHNVFMEVNVHEAKTNFSKLLQRVAAGEEIIIAKAGVPVAKLVPVEQKRPKRKLGLYSGEIWIADDFDAPLPDDVLASFYGEDAGPKKKTTQAAARRRRQVR
jgi:prevent-host-death family protein